MLVVDTSELKTWCWWAYSTSQWARGRLTSASYGGNEGNVGCSPVASVRDNRGKSCGE